MGILIRIVLAITAMVSMSLSSLGFRSNNFIIGFIFVIIALIALVFLLRFLWELMGCFITMFLILGLILLVLYATGSFSGGTGLIPEKLTSFIGLSAKEPQENQTLYGEAIAISGDTFRMGNEVFYLYGVSAPKLNQTCINNIGRHYSCGNSSKLFLAEKLQENQPVCTTISSAPKQGDAVPAICNIGKYDLGALMISGGWAIPSTSGGIVYVAYETEAKKRKQGMWQGAFSSPWEWERVQADQQNRMQSIKVEQPQKEPSLLMKNLWN